MGLDHWAYVYNEDGTRRNIATWRKNYEVHEIMARHWKRDVLGGERADRRGLEFNCVEIEVTNAILDDVEAMFDTDHLLPPSHQDIETAKFVGAARELLRRDIKVYYNSWW